MGRACTHRRAEIGIQEGTGTSATWWPSWWSPSSSLSGQRASGQAAPSRPSICAPPLLPLRRRTFTIRMVLPPFPRRKTGWRTIRGSVPSVLCYVERRRRGVGGTKWNSILDLPSSLEPSSSPFLENFRKEEEDWFCLNIRREFRSSSAFFFRFLLLLCNCFVFFLLALILLYFFGREERRKLDKCRLNFYWKMRDWLRNCNVIERYGRENN